METLSDTVISSKSLSDELIIREIINGDKELFEKLMKRYNQRLFRVIRGYIKDEEEVHDVMQETYLKAYENLSKFRSDSSFSTWLIRIGINEALQRLRRIKKRWQFFSNGKAESNEFPLFSEIEYMNPEKRAIQHETRQSIERAIDHLPVKYRSVYIMREIEGLDIGETASCLGLTESNVKVRLYRAKGILKKELSGRSIEKELFEFGNEKCDALIERVMQKIRERSG